MLKTEQVGSPAALVNLFKCRDPWLLEVVTNHFTCRVAILDAPVTVGKFQKVVRMGFVRSGSNCLVGLTPDQLTERFLRNEEASKD